MTTCNHSQTKLIVNKINDQPARYRIACRRCGDHARDAFQNPEWSSSASEAKQTWAEYQTGKVSA
jgi:hypothetical protein